MTLAAVWFVSLFRGSGGSRRLLPPTWKLQEDLVQPEVFQPVIHESKFQGSSYLSFRLIVLLFFGGRDQSCGKLFCSGGWEFPITSKKFFYKLGNGNLCNEAAMNSEDNFPQDLAMVPTGTKCGTNMVSADTVSI